MSIQLTEEDLKTAVNEGTFIVNGEVGCVEGIKYDFRLGNRILCGGGQPFDVSGLSETDKSKLAVKPGELVYVLTEETLQLPHDVKAELSLKRKISHSGIQVLGGFCIDPGYKGKLLFGLYNLSNAPFPLEPGRKLIAAQFYRLSPDEVPPPIEGQDEIDDFPRDLVRLMSMYEPTSIEGLHQAFEELIVKFKELKEEIDKREQWFIRFEENLDKLNEQIDKVAKNLEKENDSRQVSEQEFRRDLKNIQRDTIQSATKTSILSAISVGFFIGVLLLIIRFLFMQ